MKKSLMTIAAALALVSCSQEDLLTGLDGKGNGAVGVNTFVAQGSRGVAFNDAEEFEATDNGFDLFAFESDGTQFMGTESDGTEFAYNAGWDYADKGEIKFWQQVAEGNTVTFYAVSPANTTTLNITNDAQTIEYTVADNSADQKDLMYAKTTGVDPTDETIINNGVSIAFYHALSQIVFKAKVHEDYASYINAAVAGVEIVNLQNTGTFTFAEAGFGEFSTTYEPWSDTSGEASYIAEVDAAGVEVNTELNSSDAVDLTTSSTALLLMPQEITGATVEDNKIEPTDGGTYIKVTCKVYYKGTNDTDATQIVGTEDETSDIYIPLTTTWQAGWKYIYTLVFSHDMADPVTINEDLYVGPWHEDHSDHKDLPENGEAISPFTMDVDNTIARTPSRLGYTDILAFTSGSAEAPVVEYSADGINYYTDANSANMDWVTVSSETSSYTTRSTLNSFKYEINVSPLSYITEVGTYWDALKANGIRGDYENLQPWNLATHTLEAEESSTCSTANCYVVNAAGYYSFPVVYGNAIDGYLLNENAFVGSFVSSDIPEAVTAEVLWSTIEGLVTDVQVEEEVDNNGYWNKIVTFKVDETKLNEGNVVIAVKDGSGNITWSWHIWVTPVDFTPVLTNNETQIYAMPVNVGWVSDNTSVVEIKKYIGRSGYIRFTQGEVSFEHYVYQNSHCCVDAVAGGKDVYYQWGRKDPFVEGRYTNQSSGSIQSSINNPNVFYTSAATNLDGGMWNDFSYDYNIWNAGVESINVDADYTVKTIFDPCPIGFAVAPTTAFKDLSGTDGYAETGFTYTNEGESALFPLTGWIDYSGQSQNQGTYGACWESTLKSKTWGYGVLIDSTDGFTNKHGNMMMGAAYPVRPVVAYY